MPGDISGVREIYIVTGYTDMRKSLDGLCSIIEEQFSMKVSSSALYLFCGKKCDRIKALLREPDGMTLLYKRLSVSQGRYRWPRNKSEVRNLTWQEFDRLMSGLDIDQPKVIKVVHMAHPIGRVCGAKRPKCEAERSVSLCLMSLFPR